MKVCKVAKHLSLTTKLFTIIHRFECKSVALNWLVCSWIPDTAGYPTCILYTCRNAKFPAWVFCLPAKARTSNAHLTCHVQITLHILICIFWCRYFWTLFTDLYFCILFFIELKVDPTSFNTVMWAFLLCSRLLYRFWVTIEK